MSTTSPQSAHVSILLSELLHGEKENTRVWLRAEMDRLVDPMLDSLFQRINNKLVNTDLGRFVGSRTQLVDLIKTANTQTHQSSSNIRQPSTPSTSALSTTFNPSSLHSHSISEIYSEILAQVKRDSMTLQNGQDIPQANEQIQDCVKQEIKEEFEDGVMMQIKKEEEVEEEENEQTQVNDIDIHRMAEDNESGDEEVDQAEFDNNNGDEMEDNQNTEPSQLVSNGYHLFIDSMTLQNGQDIPQANEQIQDWVKQEIKEEYEDGEMMQIKKEEEVEEEENEQTQVNDIEGMAEDNESGDEDDQVETEIDDGDKMEDNQNTEPSQPVINELMDTTLPHPKRSPVMKQSARFAKRKQTDNEEPSNQVNNDDGAGEGTSRPTKRPRPSRSATSNDAKEKQLITVTLRCDQVGCEKMVDKDQFNSHMLMEHSIRQSRCPVKDCAQSFDNRGILCQHIGQSHQHSSPMKCNKCDKQFTSYPKLSSHSRDYHELGHFRCSFPSCEFTGDCRRKMYTHYREHKQTKKCQHLGCTYETWSTNRMKSHQETHLDIKLYRCKWPQCDYASRRNFYTMRHIREKHFVQDPSLPSNGVQLGDPKDYLEVIVVECEK